MMQIGRRFQKYFLIFFLHLAFVSRYESVIIKEKDLDKQTLPKMKSANPLVSLQGILKSEFLGEEIFTHKPSSVEELIQICTDAPNKVLVFGGGAIFNFGNSYLHFGHDRFDAIYKSNQVTPNDEPVMHLSNTKLPEDITLVSTALLRSISIHLNNSEPYVWADAGVTFGTLTDFL